MALSGGFPLARANAAESTIKPITVFAIPVPEFLQFNAKTKAEHFSDIQNSLGVKGKWGRVGLAFNFPYTSFVIGDGPANFSLDPARLAQYEEATKTAHRMQLPVLVGFNGSVWAEPGGAFNAYWKTAGGGKYLSRYSDGKINDGLPQTSGDIKPKLKSYLSINAGHPNYLNLTFSPQASQFQKSRLKLLDEAAEFWQKLKQKYPGTIVSATTDSEVSFFSFRKNSHGAPLQIGYEDLLTVDFCNTNNIKPEALSQALEENPVLSKSWHIYRSKIVKDYVAASVDVVKARLPNTQIYTHQIPCGKTEFTKDGIDFDCPLESAVIPGAIPGYTIYIWGHREKFLLDFLQDLKSEEGATEWGAMEFNPGKDWPGSKEELRIYTRKILSELYRSGVNAIAPLAWNSSELDAGIKGTGVDQGIEDFIKAGPSPETEK